MSSTATTTTTTTTTAAAASTSMRLGSRHASLSTAAFAQQQPATAAAAAEEGLQHNAVERTGQQEELMDPSKLANGTIPMPKSLSPSAIMEFKQCPQSYLFQYLYGLRQPTNEALALGSMCHEALEKLFDLEPSDRTLTNLQNLFRSSWAHHRRTATYQDLFGTATTTTTTTTTTNETSSSVMPEYRQDLERQWGQSGLRLLENYVQVEDPTQVTRPNPLQREVWVRADLPLLSSSSVAPAPVPAASTVSPTAAAIAQEENTSNVQQQQQPTTNDKTFHVRGIVDRLDMVRVVVPSSSTHNDDSTTSTNDSGVALRIVDYKSGKAPNLKYSQAMNEQIAEEAFYQLKIYALLLREKQLAAATNGSAAASNGGGDQSNGRRSPATASTSLPVRMLRLLYLTSASNRGQYLDYDLGATQEERNAVLDQVHADLSDVWMSICQLVETQDPKAFVGCNRSFCYCHKCRPKFVPGTVWEP